MHEGAEITFRKVGKEVKSTVEKEVNTQMETFFSNARSRLKRGTGKGEKVMTQLTLRDLQVIDVSRELFD